MSPWVELKEVKIRAKATGLSQGQIGDGRVVVMTRKTVEKRQVWRVKGIEVRDWGWGCHRGEAKRKVALTIETTGH